MSWLLSSDFCKKESNNLNEASDEIAVSEHHSLWQTGRSRREWHRCNILIDVKRRWDESVGITSVQSRVPNRRGPISRVDNKSFGAAGSDMLKRCKEIWSTDPETWLDDARDMFQLTCTQLGVIVNDFLKLDERKLTGCVDWVDKRGNSPTLAHSQDCDEKFNAVG